MTQPEHSTAGDKLDHTADGLLYAGEQITYRISGLTAHNLDRLRVTLKAMLSDEPATFHIDTIDLYYSRAREGFAESCVKYLRAQHACVMAELALLIAALESERVAMRERGSAPVIVTMQC
jgi:hypothetical protein